MAKTTISVVPYRRKRKGKTNYKKRLALLKSGQPRLVIRLSNTSVKLQLVKYEPDGDKVLAAFDSTNLSKLGWNYSKKSIPACYLAGLQFAILAKKASIVKANVDLGLQTSITGSRLFAAVKGVVDGGMEIPCKESVFPPEERLSGKHIANVSSNQLTGYKKNGLDPKKIPETFELVKNKIQS